MTELGILLHGRNGTPEQMLKLAATLELDHVRWIALAAENRTWYPNRFMEPIAGNEPFLSRGVAQCNDAVSQALDGKPEHIAIIGFSQGACVALEYALRHPDKCRSIVAFTGCLIGPAGTDWRARAAGSLQGTRILLTGSDADPWVPTEYLYDTARVLESLGADLRLRVYGGRPHVVSDEEIAEARRFLSVPASQV